VQKEVNFSVFLICLLHVYSSKKNNNVNHDVKIKLLHRSFTSNIREYYSIYIQITSVFEKKIDKNKENSKNSYEI